MFLSRMLIGQIAASLLAVPSIALACKPVWNEVSSYVQNKIPYHAVFAGTVASVSEIEKFENGARYDIVFRQLRWFGGREQAEMTVRGIRGSMAGTDCEGLSDFLPKVGDQWLVFGQVIEGKVNVDLVLSRRIVDGRLPEDFRAELERNGISF